MNIYGMTKEKLRDFFCGKGENPAKAEIVFDGLYRRGIESFSRLTLSERVIKMLEECFDISLPEIVEIKDGGNASKLLLRMSDGEMTETVLMRQSFGDCVCVSTQVGCNMACVFCQSGRLKKRRGLAAHEIVGQVMAVRRKFGVKIHAVTVMGIGEPFDNYDNVIEFCQIMSSGRGLEIGQRHLTVSTCGIVPRIYDYSALARPFNLAVSLHAPNDSLRTKLMPVNKKYPLAQVIEAAEYYCKRTNRRVELEYIMLNGINDGDEHALQLAELIGKRDFYVNIIPYNTTDCCYAKSGSERIERFYDLLKKNGVRATTRKKFGTEVNAACGQLRADYLRTDL